MQIKHTIFVGIVAALTSLTAPALAKNSDARNSDAQTPASSSCSALQQTADGTWARLPCQELGSPRPQPRKSAARSSDRQTH
jgi:hypothetical protein